jgi:hypothetical protein
MEWILLQAGLREVLRLSPGARALYLGPDGKRFKERPLPLPFLDGGTPSAEEIALRLRAVDLVLIPSKEGCRADDQGVLASLCNGTPMVSSTPGQEIDSGFGVLPEGVDIVLGNELGAYLEAIERACERALGACAEEVEAGIQDYYERRFGQAWLRHGVLPVI